MRLIHLLTTILLLTVGDVQPRVLVVGHGLLLQEQVEEEERILDQSRDLRVGEWTEIGLHRRLLVVDEIGLHHRLLVVDEIGLIITVVVMTVTGSESESKIEIGVLLPRVGRLRLLVGTDKVDLHLRISRDVMRPCMRGEGKMYVMEEEVDIGVEREIEDMKVVAVEGSKGNLVQKHPDILLIMRNIVRLSATST